MHNQLLRLFCCVFIISVLLGCKAKRPSETRSQHPNILLMMVGDLNDIVSALDGHPQAQMDMLTTMKHMDLE